MLGPIRTLPASTHLFSRAFWNWVLAFPAPVSPGVESHPPQLCLAGSWPACNGLPIHLSDNQQLEREGPHSLRHPRHAPTSRGDYSYLIGIIKMTVLVCFGKDPYLELATFLPTQPRFPKHVCLVRSLEVS